MSKFLEFKTKNNMVNSYHSDLDRSLELNFNILVRIGKKIRKQQKKEILRRNNRKSQQTEAGM